jgi:hypothetical protein
MTGVKPNPIVRLMPSLTDVAFLTPVLLLFSQMEGVRTLLADGDTGWHIRTGEWILAHGRVPYQDIFSFSKPGQPWFAWEWLWDVTFAWLHAQAGLAAVALASLLVISLTFALLYRLTSRRCGNPLVAIGLTAVAAAGSTVHFLARPHLFTLLFTVVTLAVLERVRESGNTRLLWWLPALTVVWANVHAGFLPGIAIVGAYAVGSLLNRDRQGADRREKSPPYAAAAAACLAASLLNPYTYHLHVHIWEFLRSSYVTKLIVEYRPVSLGTPAAAFFGIMLGLGAGAALWHVLHRRFTEALLLIVWAYLGLMAARNVPLYMLVAAPAVAPAVVAWLRRAGGLLDAVAAEIAPLDGLWRVHAVSAVALGAIALGMASPAAGRALKPVFDEKAFPAGAVAALAPSDRIFASEQWGDYLIYRLGPAGAKVFFDGRFDFYGGTFCQQYLDALSASDGWERTLSRYGVDTILLPPGAALAHTLKQSSHWRAGYDDGTAIVFRSANAAARGGQRLSTSSTGGVRDLAITKTTRVISKDHVSESKGASRL